MELVSAIITTHNRAELLMKAIESVRTQTYKNIECIVVDDASTDDTCTKMKELEEVGKIKYIRIQQSRGGNHARNTGIMTASGKYIAFLDDDDEWFSTKIEKQIEVIHSTGYSCCYCQSQQNYNNGEKICNLDVKNMKEGDLSREILKGVICTTSAMMVDRELLIKAGMFDENLRFWQEYDLCIRLFQLTYVAAVRDNLVKYRINFSDKHRLTNNLDDWEDAAEYVYKKYGDLFSSLNPEEDRERRRFYIRDALWRCCATGNKKAQKNFLKENFMLDKTVKNFVKYLLNRGMHI